MGILEGVIVYLLIWWVTLFAILPIGLVTQEEAGEVVEGSERSAPAKLDWRRKFLLTTAVAAGLWLVALIAILTDPFGLNAGIGFLND